MIVPILFFGIVTALNNSNNSSRITIKTIILFIIMFTISFLINSGFVGIIQPGASFQFTEVAWEGTLASLTFKDFILSIIHSNILSEAAGNQILPVILFSFVFGIYIN